MFGLDSCRLDAECGDFYDGLVTSQFSLKSEPSQSIKSQTTIITQLKYKTDLQDRLNYSRCKKTENSREFNM